LSSSRFLPDSNWDLSTTCAGSSKPKSHVYHFQHTVETIKILFHTFRWRKFLLILISATRWCKIQYKIVVKAVPESNYKGGASTWSFRPSFMQSC
jgi:hypothetical protein